MRHGWTRAMVTLTAAIAVVLAVGATPAHAVPVSLVNQHTQRCLADSFTNGLQVVSCDAFPAHPTQMWVDDTDQFDGYYRFRSLHTQRCIAHSYAGGLEVLPCNRTTLTQLWR